MQQYAVGFLFNRDLDRVILIQKIKGPRSIIGKLNGVGGKVEPAETHLNAVSREFFEETGVYIDTSRWDKTCVLVYRDRKVGYVGQIAFYHAVSHDNAEFNSARAMESETVGIYSINPLPNSVVPNLCWIVPLALRRIQFGFHPEITIHEIE